MRHSIFSKNSGQGKANFRLINKYSNFYTFYTPCSEDFLLISCKSLLQQMADGGQIVIVGNPRSVTGFGDDGGRHNWPLVRACDHVGDNGKVGDHNCHLGGLSLPLSWLWRGLGLQDGGNDGNQDHLCQHLPGKVQSTALLVVTKSTFKAQSHLSSWFTSHRQSLAHKNTLHLLHYHTSLFHSADPSIHSSFSPLSHIGSFYNGAIWQSCAR